MTPDTNYLSYADERHSVTHPYYRGGLIVRPEAEGKRAEDYDDLLKISGCSGLVFNDVKVIPDGVQREDAIDIMRFSHGIVLRGCTLKAGKYAVTIKGGCYDITLDDVVIERPAQGWEGVDIDIGNRSHNALGRTYGIVLSNVRRADGKPVRVRVGWADMPIVRDSNVKILRVQSMLLRWFVLARARLQGYKGPW